MFKYFERNSKERVQEQNLRTIRRRVSLDSNQVKRNGGKEEKILNTITHLSPTKEGGNFSYLFPRLFLHPSPARKCRGSAERIETSAINLARDRRHFAKRSLCRGRNTISPRPLPAIPQTFVGEGTTIPYVRTRSPSSRGLKVKQRREVGGRNGCNFYEPRQPLVPWILWNLNVPIWKLFEAGEKYCDLYLDCCSSSWDYPDNVIFNGWIDPILRF